MQEFIVVWDLLLQMQLALLVAYVVNRDLGEYFIFCMYYHIILEMAILGKEVMDFYGPLTVKMFVVLN